MTTEQLSTVEMARRERDTTGRIMVIDDCGHRRHLRLHEDSLGPYVRTGKRGTCKSRLQGHRIILGTVVEFQIG